MLWRQVIGYWKSAVVMVAIAYLSLLREPNLILPSITGLDKWIHGMMYLVLTLVLLWDVKTMWRRRSANGVDGFRVKKLWLVISIMSIVYGGIMEVLQEKYFYPRTGDWRDWIADCVGVLVGVSIWLIVGELYERRMVK